MMHATSDNSFSDNASMLSNPRNDFDSSQHSTSTNATANKVSPAPQNHVKSTIVHPDAVPGNAFVPERYAKGQCIEYERYTVTEGSEMYEYFHPLLVEAICKASALPSQVPSHEMLQKVADRIALDGSLLSILYVEYGQLEQVKNPDLSLRPPPQNSPNFMPESEFITFEAPKPRQKYTQRDRENERAGNNPRVIMMVQAPRFMGGKCYVPTQYRSSQYKVTFTLKVDDPENTASRVMEDALKIRLGVRKAGELFLLGQKVQDHTIEIQVGRFNNLNYEFSPFDIPNSKLNRVLLDDKPLTWSLFYQSNTSGQSWPKWSAQIPEEMEPKEVARRLEDGMTESLSSHKFKLYERDDAMAYYQPGKKNDEGKWIHVTNFVLKEFAGILQFTENIGSEPFLKVVCRYVVNKQNDRVLFLAADDRFRVPSLDGVGVIDVEVMLQPGKMRCSSDVSAIFSSYCGMLQATTLTPDMLRCWLSDQVRPMITECIVRFGRQKNGMFVAGNVVFHQDQIWSHEKAMICVVPSHFTGQSVPLSTENFPRNIICPFCHVRYCIGLLFMDMLSKIFCNNKIPALAVFAGGVMHLYAHNFWRGESGFGKGVPYIWAYSHAPGTGKTEILTAVNSMLGFNHVAPIGGDATIPAIVHKASDHQSCLSLCIDDVVVRQDDDGLNKLGRTMFDRCGRTVFGKKPQVIQSSMICTVSECALALHTPALALARCPSPPWLCARDSVAVYGHRTCRTCKSEGRSRLQTAPCNAPSAM